ncbi:hypothetical protein AMEX_G17079 [Astyanax mexicanus]|uniref:Uncharacterized protein n=1 Tax=Astyanax mexicanus TaxID=7994 RepID=A0A8T2L846_ASTMX|nr:hypothetical protein AMEX_G17079 [Astyanax mexicanus]
MGSTSSRVKRVAPALEPAAHLEEEVEAEEVEEEVEKILEACEISDSGLSRRLFQKAFFTSKTCGLCYGKVDNTTNTTSRGNIRLDHSEAESRNHHSSEDMDENWHKAVGGGRADPVNTKAAGAPGRCENPSLALPVFYDASEEDLMNIIEREFG